MILPLYVVLERLDQRYLEAARDLGATPWNAFWRVTVPLTMPLPTGDASGAVRPLVPIQPEPAKVLHQLELELPARALRVRVVDPKDKPALPPRRAGEQEIEECRPGPSDVELPRGRGDPAGTR